MQNKWTEIITDCHKRKNG